jgi:hypothetical protein
MRSRISCERCVPPPARPAPRYGCTPTAAHHQGGCDPGRRVRPFLTTTATSERENTMPDPDPYPIDLDTTVEFPDVLAEFGAHTSGDEDPVGKVDDGEQWPEPEDDDLDLLGRSSQAATIDYRCTRQELEEAGFGGGYTEQDLTDMPEIDSEFMAPAVVEDPRDRLEARYGCAVEDLLDSVERFDWTAMPGFQRLANVLIDGLCQPCPLVQGQ